MGRRLAIEYLKFANLMYVLYSAYIWFSFYVPHSLALALLASAFILYFVVYPRDVLPFNRLTGTVLIAGLFILVWYVYLDLLSPELYPIVAAIVCGMMLFMLPGPVKKELLKFVTKWTAVIVVVSVVVYAWVQMGGGAKVGTLRVDGYPPFDNYVFFMMNASPDVFDQVVYRFNGPFIEPGHLAMLCSFLLIANRLEMKRSPAMWVLLIAVAISFSLAGYLLLMFGFVFIKIKNMKVLVAGTALLVVGVVALVGASSAGSGGDAVQTMIIDRLMFDSSKGIKGNNRTWGHTERYFEKEMDNGLWEGIGTERYQRLMKARYIGGAGYKIYILGYGFIGALLILLFYGLIASGCKDRRFAAGFFAIMALAFLQRGYLGTYAWMFPFITALPPHLAQIGSDDLAKKFLLKKNRKETA